jgi:hypothetical protein
MIPCGPAAVPVGLEFDLMMHSRPLKRRAIFGRPVGTVGYFDQYARDPNRPRNRQGASRGSDEL